MYYYNCIKLKMEKYEFNKLELILVDNFFTLYDKLKQQNKKLNPFFFNISLLNTRRYLEEFIFNVYPEYNELFKFVPPCYFCDTKSDLAKYNLMVVHEFENTNEMCAMLNVCNSWFEEYNTQENIVIKNNIKVNYFQIVETCHEFYNLKN